jgi:hypothetical protein
MNLLHICIHVYWFELTWIYVDLCGFIRIYKNKMILCEFVWFYLNEYELAWIYLTINKFIEIHEFISYHCGETPLTPLCPLQSPRPDPYLPPWEPPPDPFWHTWDPPTHRHGGAEWGGGRPRTSHTPPLPRRWERPSPALTPAPQAPAHLNMRQSLGFRVLEF